MLSGLGLGHHLPILFDRTHGEALLVVCEPDLDVLAAAMFSVDFSRVIEGDRCLFLTRADKNVVHRKLEGCTALVMLGTQFVTHAPSERRQPQFHQAAAR